MIRTAFIYLALQILLVKSEGDAEFRSKLVQLDIEERHAKHKNKVNT